MLSSPTLLVTETGHVTEAIKLPQNQDINNIKHLGTYNLLCTLSSHTNIVCKTKQLQKNCSNSKHLYM